VPGFKNGVDRIVNNVQEHLLELVRVRDNQSWFGRQLKLDPNVVDLEVVVAQGQRFLKHFADVDFSPILRALAGERRRLGDLLATVLDERAKAMLAHLLVRDDTLSELAVLRQDAKDFRWRQMAREREKRALLDPVYQIAKALVPTLGISQQNLLYYASLANFYTVYDLRRLRPEQTHLYLLCYVWLRYRQLTDNLVDALAYHMKQLEDACSIAAKKGFDADQLHRQQETP